MTNLYAPLNILGFAYREIKQTSIDMEKMFVLLDEAPDVADAPDAARAEARARARWRSSTSRSRTRAATAASTGFPSSRPPARPPPSSAPRGAGKSTVLKLLFRFYDPAGGRVLIDGQDLRAVTQASLRSALGLVPQDVVLFNDTIRYNIGYGRPEATQAELEEAARRAQLLAFIESLPQGWDTRVGERGLKLSGGEKQRVGIARVVLKDPRILILDEATSSLDSGTEAEVQEALEDSLARAHHDRRRPPPLHHRQRRPDRRARPRPHRRTRNPCRPDRPRRALRRPLEAPSRRTGRGGRRVGAV